MVLRNPGYRIVARYSEGIVTDHLVFREKLMCGE